MASEERTLWRDLTLSKRHRLWGEPCTMVDVDFLAIEYCASRPIALVEYKNERRGEPDTTKPMYRAMREFATSAKIGFFVVIYDTDLSSWLVIPENDHARWPLPKQTVMTEKQWVTFLYGLRKVNVPTYLGFDSDGLLNKSNEPIVPEEFEAMRFLADRYKALYLLAQSQYGRKVIDIILNPAADAGRSPPGQISRAEGHRVESAPRVVSHVA